jgi:hypothetical protein
VRALFAAAWRLGEHPGLAGLRLRAWAHMLGLRGHFATKSGSYSTFTALRAERRGWTAGRSAQHAGPASSAGDAGDAETALVVESWRYAGRGYHNPADAALAAHIAAPRGTPPRTLGDEVGARGPVACPGAPISRRGNREGSIYPTRDGR